MGVCRFCDHSCCRTSRSLLAVPDFHLCKVRQGFQTATPDLYRVLYRFPRAFALRASDRGTHLARPDAMNNGGRLHLVMSGAKRTRNSSGNCPNMAHIAQRLETWHSSINHATQGPIARAQAGSDSTTTHSPATTSHIHAFGPRPIVAHADDPLGISCCATAPSQQQHQQQRVREHICVEDRPPSNLCGDFINNDGAYAC